MSNSLLAEVTAKKIGDYTKSFLDLLEGLTDEQIWSMEGNIPNSIGTLARHITGNLNHYFGAALVKSGYVRVRDREFSDRNVPKAQVIAEMKEAARIVQQALAEVDDAALSQPFTSPDGQAYESLGYYIVHMALHLAMHYGQADYAQNCVKSAKTA